MMVSPAVEEFIELETNYTMSIGAFPEASGNMVNESAYFLRAERSRPLPSEIIPLTRLTTSVIMSR